MNTILFNQKYPNKEVYDTLLVFEELFEPIIELKENDKLGLFDTFSNITYDSNNFQTMIDLPSIKSKLYLDKSTFYQGISRWWNNQKRSLIYENLYNLLDTYNKFTRYISIQNNDNHFMDVNNKINILNSKISKGLCNLKKSYEEDSNIIKKLDDNIALLSKFF